jgi:hypothetical protein
MIRPVRVEAKGEWSGQTIACRIAQAKMSTTVPNTTEQTFDAVKRDWDAHPLSEAEIEKRLSTRPATKRRMETMRSWGRKSIVGDKYFSALCQRW